VEELSVEERSISPADILAQGRRAIHLLRTPLFTNAFYLWVNATLRIERRTHRRSRGRRLSPFAGATYSNSWGRRLYAH
jgi:hypothetical protein